MACIGRRAVMQEYAARYRARGWNPLPSRADKKQPTLKRYTYERDFGLSDRQFWAWDGDNIQLALGARWGLVVVDIDGPGSLRVWEEFEGFYGTAETWSVTNRDADGSVRGRHLYFAVRRDGGPVASRVLWGVWTGSGWAKRWQIELKADRSLIVAPPSVHPETGMTYWWDDSTGPDFTDAPAELPGWVLELPDPRPAPDPLPLPARPRALPLNRPAPAGDYDRSAVLALVPDKVALAEEWGLRIAGPRAPLGRWQRCHAAGRPDRNPSGSISTVTGCYSDSGQKPVSLWDLAVLLGAHPTWRHALAAAGRRFGAKPRNDRVFLRGQTLTGPTASV